MLYGSVRETLGVKLVDQLSACSMICIILIVRGGNAAKQHRDWLIAFVGCLHVHHMDIEGGNVAKKPIK